MLVPRFDCRDNGRFRDSWKVLHSHHKQNIINKHTSKSTKTFLGLSRRLESIRIRTGILSLKVTVRVHICLWFSQIGWKTDCPLSWNHQPHVSHWEDENSIPLNAWNDLSKAEINILLYIQWPMRLFCSISLSLEVIGYFNIFSLWSLPSTQWPGSAFLHPGSQDFECLVSNARVSIKEFITQLRTSPYMNPIQLLPSFGY